MKNKKQNKGELKFFSNPWTSIRVGSDVKDWLSQITPKGCNFNTTIWFLFEFAMKGGKVDKFRFKDNLRQLKMLRKEINKVAD